MKNLWIILVTCALWACHASDKKSGPVLTDEEKELAAKDSMNFTSIEWIDSTVKNLGKIKEGQVAEVSFRFRNAGEKPLIITNVTASCGCTVPEKPERPFLPGEEGVIRAKFDSRGRPAGENRKDVYVTANTKPETSMQLSFKVEITE